MRVVSFTVPAWFPSYETPETPETPGAHDTPDAHGAPQAQLTEQESAVFLCLATGASNRELAAELQLSVSTVKFHVVNIRAKLGGISRLQACLLAALARRDTQQDVGQDPLRDIRQDARLNDGGAAAGPR
ncbi:helix-turn-helix transcriptional regulator [Streptomyces sp. NPDC048269]|uniref:response regulator transcription factor n=1 Tax=Streptomyces sp. NPDC048269 TaxID=3155753 RepID=UPI00342641FF